MTEDNHKKTDITFRQALKEYEGKLTPMNQTKVKDP